MDFDIHQLDGMTPIPKKPRHWRISRRRCWSGSPSRRRARTSPRPIRTWASGQPN